MILSFTFKSSGTDLSSVQQVMAFVQGYPIRKIYVGSSQVLNNYNIENDAVKSYNSRQYSVGDCDNSYAKTNPNNNYICSYNINENYSEGGLHARLDPYGEYGKGDFRMFPCNNDLDNPDAGVWPSPIYIKSAITRVDGDNITFGTQGTTIKFYFNPAFADDPSYIVPVTGHVTPVYNLLPRVTYYYRVYDSNNKVISELTGQFTTQGQIRMLRIDQVHNVRDLGGWPTIDGKTVRYGKLFRGGQFEQYNSSPTSATLSKAANLFKQLEITKSIDFRAASNSSSSTINAFSGITIRETVNGTKSSASYSNVASNFTQFLNFVRIILTNSDSTYFHCQQGRDRTGSFAAILEALIGVTEDGIIKDYELTWGIQRTTRYTMNTVYDDDKTSNLWGPFASYSGSNIQTKVQNWFINNYNSSSKITGYSAGADVIAALKSALLVDAGITPSPSGKSNFVEMSGWKPSTSSAKIYKETCDWYKYYELSVPSGTTITLPACSGHVWFIESANGLASTLTTATATLTSGWTKWTHVEQYSSYTYTVVNTGKVMIIENVSASDNVIISYPESQDPDPMPSGTVDTLVAKHMVHSWGDSTFTYFEYKGGTYNGTTCFQFNVAKDDMITVKSISRTLTRLKMFYVETNVDIVGNLRTSTSKYTPAYIAQRSCRNPADSTATETVTEPKYDKTSQIRWNKQVVKMNNNCKLVMIIRNDDEPINTSDYNSRTIAIYKNGDLIYGPNIEDF